jgi:hypothetical protein
MHHLVSPTSQSLPPSPFLLAPADGSDDLDWDEFVMFAKKVRRRRRRRKRESYRLI